MDPAASSTPEQHCSFCSLLRMIFSMKVLLCLFCVAAVASASFPAWYLTYNAGVDALDNILRDFQLQIVPLISQTIMDRLTGAESLVTHSKLNFQRGLYSLSDLPAVLNDFWTVLHSTTYSSDVWVTSKSGGMWGQFRHPDGLYTSVWLYNESNQNQTEWYTDSSGNTTSLNWWAIVDNTQQVYYTVVDKSDRTNYAWTPLYPWFGRMWLSYCTGAYAPSGEFLGVVGVDMMLGFLDSVLTDLHLKAGSSIYIVDALTSYMIAAYPKLRLVTCDGGTGPNCDGGSLNQVAWQSLNNPIITGIFNLVQSKYGNWMNVHQEVLKLEAQGTKYAAIFQPITSNTLRWTIVQATNMDLILDPVNERTKVVFGTVLGIIGAVAVVSVGITYAILRPLGVLSARAAALSEMDVGVMQQRLPPSLISEVNGLVSAFNFLTASLLAMRAYMPESMFQRATVTESIHGDDEDEHMVSDGPQPPTRTPSTALLVVVQSPTTLISDGEDSAGCTHPLGVHRSSRAPRNSSSVGSELCNQASDDNRKHSSSQSRESKQSRPSREAKAPAYASPSTVVWRTISVLCADMVGFQAYVHKHSPAEVTQLHGAYIDIVHDCVTRNEGLLDKVVGDRALVVWNGLRRVTQAELKAVRCGLELGQACRTLWGGGGGGSSSSPPLRKKSAFPGEVGGAAAAQGELASGIFVRVGIASSKALCGNMGGTAVKMFVMVGDAVSHAVLLQKYVFAKLKPVSSGACAGAGIVISEPVAKQVECNVQCVPACILKLPNASALRCYFPTQEHSSHQADDEWMYQLAKQDTTRGSDMSAVFAKYHDHVTRALSPRAATMTTTLDFEFLESDSPPLRRLKELIQEYPDGLPVPYMP